MDRVKLAYTGWLLRRKYSKIIDESIRDTVKEKLIDLNNITGFNDKNAGATLLSDLTSFQWLLGQGKDRVSGSVAARAYTSAIYDCLSLWKDIWLKGQWRLRSKEGKVVKDNPLLKLLNGMNDWGQSGQYRMQITLEYYWLFGNALWFVEWDTANTFPVGLYPLSSEEFKDVILDSKGRIKYYERYLPDSNETELVPAKNIIHFKTTNPFDRIQRFGYPPIFAAATNIDELILMHNSRMALLKNGLPPMVWISENYHDPNSVKKIQDVFEQNYIGRDDSGTFKTGKSAWLTGGFKPVKLPVEFDNLMFETNLDNAIHRIYKAFGGVSPSMLGEIDNANKDSMMGARTILYSDRIKPKAHDCAANVSAWFERNIPNLEQYELDGATLDYYIEVPQEDLDKLKLYSTMYLSGMTTKREAREPLDLPTLGDEIDDIMQIPANTLMYNATKQELVLPSKEYNELNNNNSGEELEEPSEPEKEYDEVGMKSCEKIILSVVRKNFKKGRDVVITEIFKRLNEERLLLPSNMLDEIVKEIQLQPTVDKVNHRICMIMRNDTQEV